MMFYLSFKKKIMKFNKAFILAAALFAGILTPSCNNMEEQIFEESAPLRMQKVLDQTKSILTSSPDGWIFEYTPDRKLRYGTIIYHLKFDNEMVEARAEFAEKGEMEKTYYKFTKDNGPTLTFDVYSKMLHKYATPSGAAGDYQAKDGDFEFTIMEAQPDVITLKGKRSGNIMHLRKFTGNGEEYINSVKQTLEDIWFPIFEGNIAGVKTKVEMNSSSRYITFTPEDGKAVGAYYIPTNTGIHLMEPAAINGIELNDISFDNRKDILFGKDSNNGEFSMEMKLPEDYTKFLDWEGNYTLTYNNMGGRAAKTMDIQLVPDEDNKRYIVKNMVKDADVIALYDRNTGYLDIRVQQVGKDDTYTYWIYAGNLNPETGSGSSNNGTSNGIFLKKDLENPGKVLITKNAGTFATNSLFLKRKNAAGSASNSAAPWLFTNNGYQINWITHLEKK